MPCFQYKIERDKFTSGDFKGEFKVLALYKKFGFEYEELLNYVLTASLRDVVSTFEAYNLVSDRDTLGDSLKSEVEQRLKGYGIEVKGYQVSWWF